MKKSEIILDEIGKWSQEKLITLEKYAKAYVTIMKSQAASFRCYYIDPFCGAGVHIDRDTKEIVKGSPIRVLAVNPPFDRYYLIDENEEKTNMIKKICDEYFPCRNVHVKTGDCNEILQQLLPEFLYENYERLFCFVDPYGMHVDWKIIQKIGQSQIADLFINFPMMDVNRNALWHDPEKIPESLKIRMDRFWGDGSWFKILYSREEYLFEMEEKKENLDVANAFCKRLKQVAGFKYVSHPEPMKNSIGATLYYLILASQKEAGRKIANDIFNSIRRNQ